MRRYTWKPDLPDHRDHLYAAAPAALPAHVDLQPKCPPVFDQGQLGSCTANALAGAVAFVHPGLLGSRLFVYYNERSIEGTVAQDAGAQIRDGVKSLAKQGICQETEWPYVVSRFKRKPAARCYADAKPHAISEYQRLTTLDDMLHCLAGGYPFVFGFTVFDAFESDAVAKTGVLNMPTRGERNLGGHAVAAVGYDLAGKRFKVRNSWGGQWGQQGYFTMPFEYLTHRGLSDDFWTIRGAG
jgi:C1A family cysteine protease